jgi:methionine sulfoxide reductase heme-binding subunit
VGTGTALAVAAFWLGRLDWDPEMRLWRAVGDAGFVLLVASLALGPAAKLASRFGRLLPWRRELGVWCAMASVVHALLILDGWARWSLERFLGYEYVPQLGRVARMEPGFGLANMLGVVALCWLVVLAATSSDRALRSLGPDSWKWLHNAAYTVFYLTVLHSAYFLFLHYTESFHRVPPPPNWFRFPVVAMGVGVLVLQGTAFVQGVRRRRGRVSRTAL